MLRLTSWALALSMLLAVACGESTEGAGGTGAACVLPPVESSPTCTAFCAQVIGNCAAWATSEECCRRGCQKNLDDESARAEACGEAVEGVFLCVSELDDCQSVLDWQAQDPRDAFPCRPDVLVVDELIADGTCLP